MSPIQRDGLIRQLLMIGGSMMGTYFVNKGLLSKDDLSFVQANGPAIVGLLMAFGGFIWGVISRKQANIVAAVAKMPEVQQVVTVPSADGQALAATADATAGSAGSVVSALDLPFVRNKK